MLSIIVVSNRNAWRHCRAQAALASTQGVKLFTIDQLAARLAGGFLQPVDGDHLAAAVAEAIKLPLGALDAVKALPGFQRAAASSLSKAWSAASSLPTKRPPQRTSWNKGCWCACLRASEDLMTWSPPRCRGFVTPSRFSEKRNDIGLDPSRLPSGRLIGCSGTPSLGKRYWRPLIAEQGTYPSCR